MQLSNLARFWIKIIFTIPSIGCSIFILYHFVDNRTFRRALSNHVIIVIVVLILIIQSTDGIWILYFYQARKPLFSTLTFCRIWSLIDHYTPTVMVFLIGWTSIERHILIFHDRLVSTTTKRLLIHYFPLAFCVVYPLMFNIIAFYIVPCNNTLDYTLLLCGSTSCIYRFRIVNIWDSIVHNLLPISTVIIFSFSLLARITWQKHRLLQRIQWRRYRKMTIQLLSISIIFCLLYVPPVLLYIAYTLGLPSNIAADYYSSSWYFIYFTFLFIPITFSMSLSKFRKKFKTIFC